MENQINSDGLAAAVSGVDLPPVSPQLFPNVEPDGEIFDPAIHAVNEDGSPRLTMAGKFAKKRGKGSWKGGKETTTPTIDEEAKRKAAAQAFATLFLSLARGVGGEEWSPEPGEREEIAQAFDDYFSASGTIDLPPSLVLLSALAGYGMRRLDQPQTQARIGKFMRKIRGIPDPEKRVNGEGQDYASTDNRAA